jgi:hypothetical protein
MQTSLFPIDIEDAEPEEIGAHLRKVGHDAQGRRFFVKRLEDGNWLPLTEWLCHSIARLCNIATPDFLIAADTLNHNQPVFASVFQDGELFKTKQISMAQIIDKINGRIDELVDVLYLDLVLQNKDRNFRNFIFSNKRPYLYAFDYGCSQILKSACGAQIDDCKDKTSQTIALVLLQAKNSNHIISTNKISLSIQNISTDKIEKIIDELPTILMQQAGVDCIIEWWKSKTTEGIHHAKSTFSNAEVSALRE